MLQSSQPSRPWEKVGADFFQLKDSTYLVVVDYYSRYTESWLHSHLLESSLHWKPYSLTTVYVLNLGVTIDCNSLHNKWKNLQRDTVSIIRPAVHTIYPQSNGLAKGTVKTVKKLISNTDDPYLALLSYRATPIPWCGLSPAELFMGRHIRADVLQIKKYLTPSWLHLKDFREKDKKYKLQQKQYCV